MKYSKLLLIIMFIIPWLTLPLLGKKSLKRFLPAGIFISLVVTFESILAKRRRWWWWHESIHPKLQGGFPLTWGPFLIGTMWILKLTYGKFFIYLIVNLVVDTLFTYPFVLFLKKQGIASLVRLKKYQLSVLFFVKSLLLYGFQYIKERLTLRK
jgi:hypothetical protein